MEVMHFIFIHLLLLQSVVIIGHGLEILVINQVVFGKNGVVHMDPQLMQDSLEKLPLIVTVKSPTLMSIYGLQLLPPKQHTFH